LEVFDVGYVIFTFSDGVRVRVSVSETVAVIVMVTIMVMVWASVGQEEVVPVVFFSGSSVFFCSSVVFCSLDPSLAIMKYLP